MPAEGLAWQDKTEFLSLSELMTVTGVAAERFGIRRFKLTGGEPTLRPDLVEIVRRLGRLAHPHSSHSSDGDISLTTNGQLLAGMASELRSAGLDRVTVSVDSLQQGRFRAITRTGDLNAVMRGLEAALAAGFSSVKINCVVMKGINEDEVADFARLTLGMAITVRFIEYMPLGDAAYLRAAELPAAVGPSAGCGGQLRGEVWVPESEVRARIERELGPLVPVDRQSEPGVGPAIPYQLAGARGRVAFISAMSAPFCDTCNRLRLTADGLLRACLFDGGEVDTKPLLRGGLEGDQAEALAQAMVDCVAQKPDTHSARGGTAMSRIGG